MKPFRHGKEALSRAATRGEVGTAAVEFAIVGTVFFTFLFFIFDFGISLNAREAIRNGVREAGRLAIAQSTTVNPMPAPTCTPVGLSITATTADKQLVCLVKNDIGLNASSTRVWVSWPDVTANAGDHIRICAMSTTQGSTGLTAPFMPSRVTSEVVLRLEQPFPDTNNLQETQSSGTWTFCT